MLSSLTGLPTHLGSIRQLQGPRSTAHQHTSCQRVASVLGLATNITTGTVGSPTTMALPAPVFSSFGTESTTSLLLEGVPTTAQHPWTRLGTPSSELRLEFCLPTGQSFRWRQTAVHEYTGLIGNRLVRMQQGPIDVQYQVLARGDNTAPQDDDVCIRDYFNLSTPLLPLTEQWALQCPRFAAITPFFTGARMLRQDPVECLFQFICSSNNHISRIHGMVERLCSAYGTPLHPAAPAQHQEEEQQQQLLESQPLPQQPSQALDKPAFMTDMRVTGNACLDSSPATPAPTAMRSRSAQVADDVSVKREARSSLLLGPLEMPELQRSATTPLTKLERDSVVSTEAGQSKPHSLSFFAFPTLEQLSVATEEELRAAGFGYRAKFITGSVRMLLAKPGGGREWLLGLRQAPYAEAARALEELPGIGPKVAACVALFSLDKHDAIPVDTHVWQIACRYYMPSLKGKSLTKKLHADVAAAFTDRFGAYAGWAHNTLFISELASQRERLPHHLRPPHLRTSGGKRGASTAVVSEDEEEESMKVVAPIMTPPPPPRKRKSLPVSRQSAKVALDVREGI